MSPKICGSCRMAADRTTTPTCLVAAVVCVGGEGQLVRRNLLTTWGRTFVDARTYHPHALQHTPFS